MLKLKLQYSGHLMWGSDSFEKTLKKKKNWKTLMLGKMEGGRRRGRQKIGWMASLTWWTWVWVTSGSWSQAGRPDVLQSLGSQRVRHDWATELNWRPQGQSDSEMGLKPGFLTNSNHSENNLNTGVFFSLSGTHLSFLRTGASPVAQMIKNLPAVQKTWVWSLG